jgi:hypothetical protein
MKHTLDVKKRNAAMKMTPASLARGHSVNAL